MAIKRRFLFFSWRLIKMDWSRLGTGREGKKALVGGLQNNRIELYSRLVWGVREGGAIMVTNPRVWEMEDGAVEEKSGHQDGWGRGERRHVSVSSRSCLGAS